MRARDQTRLVHSVRANMAPEKGSTDTKETVRSIACDLLAFHELRV